MRRRAPPLIRPGPAILECTGHQHNSTTNPRLRCVTWRHHLRPAAIQTPGNVNNPTLSPRSPNQWPALPKLFSREFCLLMLLAAGHAALRSVFCAEFYIYTIANIVSCLSCKNDDAIHSTCRLRPASAQPLVNGPCIVAHRRVSCRANKPPAGAFPRASRDAVTRWEISWLLCICIYYVFLFTVYTAASLLPCVPGKARTAAALRRIGSSCCFVLFPLLHGLGCSSMSG